MGPIKYPSGELWTDQTDSRYELARRFVFAGKEQDIHTGLIDFGARSYDARQGQWLSPDPVLQAYLLGDINSGVYFPRNLALYSYAVNSPIALKDGNGAWFDAVVDAAFIAYDIQQLVNDYRTTGGQNATANWIALGIDVAMVFAPGTGGGTAYRTLQADKRATQGAVQAGREAQKETSRSARREAMRQQDIPTSQQPKSQAQNDAGRSYEYDVPKPGGGTQQKSVQQQTMDSSHPDQAHWEAGPVKTNPTGEPRMTEHGRPKLTNEKSKVDYSE